MEIYRVDLGQCVKFTVLYLVSNNREWVVNLKNKRKELQGLNGAIGLVVGLGGYIGHLYPATFATFAMLAIWIIGATAINLWTDPTPKK